MNRLGDRYTGLGTQTLAPEKRFKFSQFFFYKKYFEVAITDFTMYLIISRWLRRQKCREKVKTLRQKEVEAKEETAYESIFMHLNTY